MAPSARSIRKRLSQEPGAWNQAGISPSGAPVVSEDGARREVAAHAVHASSRGRRRRADENARGRCGVRGDPRDGPREQLPEVLDASVDVSTDVVGVSALHIAWSHDVTLQNDVAEARGE